MLAPVLVDVSRDAGRARTLALAVPVALLGGALLSEYVGGLYPCEMCWWQRYPHAVAIVLAGAAFTAAVSSSRARALTGLAAAAIAVSGAIGAFHAGVEYGWWEGLTRCTSGGPVSLDDILSVPLVRCDQPEWTFGGISLAGFNAILSLAAAALIGGLLMRSHEVKR